MKHTDYRDDYDADPEPRKPAGCRGWASYDGPCGATDCPSCYPGSWDQEDSDECADCGERCACEDLEEGLCPECYPLRAISSEEVEDEPEDES